MNDKLALLEEKEIRKTWEDNKWYFSIEDVIFALTESRDSKQYINKKEHKLQSIMLEINKRIYLNSFDDFIKLKNSINDYYKKLEEL